MISMSSDKWFGEGYNGLLDRCVLAHWWMHGTQKWVGAKTLREICLSAFSYKQNFRARKPGIKVSGAGRCAGQDMIGIQFKSNKRGGRQQQS